MNNDRGFNKAKEINMNTTAASSLIWDLVRQPSDKICTVYTAGTFNQSMSRLVSC